MCLAFNLEQDHEPFIEPTGVAADAATIFFNLHDYRVISTTISAGRRQVIVEPELLPGCPSWVHCFPV
ncbi:hypothetical protein ASF64_02095 [Arthrobacter sp. Leaf137]|nr:hypothetical protein ASF64_02095 [Arthrobacter sp. Leaf137]